MRDVRATLQRVRPTAIVVRRESGDEIRVAIGTNRKRWFDAARCIESVVDAVEIRCLDREGSVLAVWEVGPGGASPVEPVEVPTVVGDGASASAQVLSAVVPLADLVMRHVHALAELQLRQYAPAMSAQVAAISALADRLAHVEKAKATAEANAMAADARRLEVEAQAAIAQAEGESSGGGGAEKMLGELIPLVMAQRGGGGSGA